MGTQCDAQGAPCPPLPSGKSWNTPAGYSASKDSIEKVLRWLCNTPLNVQILQRSEANACVLIWLAGTSEVTVNVDTRSLPFLELDEELLFPVVHGMTLYQLNHPKECDLIKLHAKGLENLAYLALQSEALRSEKMLKPLFRAHRRGELNEYVKSNLSDRKS